MLTAAVAARGTATAFPRYEAAHGYDSFMYAVKPLPKIATLPEVARKFDRCRFVSVID